MSEAAPRHFGLESESSIKVFDLTSSARYMCYDLLHNTYGEGVLPETKQHVLRQELTLIAEAFDANTRTTTEMRRGHDGKFVYWCNGKWSPYASMLDGGQLAAEKLVADEPDFSFMLEWVEKDRENALQMEALTPGERYTWYSSFPHEAHGRLSKRYGSKCADEMLIEQGLNPERQMGLIYQARCCEDGRVVLESQTIDNSDEDAYNWAIYQAKTDPNLSLDGIVQAYDEVMNDKDPSGDYYAGRAHEDRDRDAWQFIDKQHDLKAYLLEELEGIAKSRVYNEITGEEFEFRCKYLIYGLWGLFKERFAQNHEGQEAAFATTDYHDLSVISQQAHLESLRRESHSVVDKLIQRGAILIGCGVSVSMTREDLVRTVVDSSPNTVFSSIFSGNEKLNYKFDKKMFCVVCQAPPKGSDKEKACGPCGLCRGCDRAARIKESRSAKAQYTLAT